MNADKCRFVLFTVILLSVLAGCIAPEVQEGNPAEYELPGIENTTVFYLNVSEVQVVGSVINATSAEFVIPDRAEMYFRNPVAVDYSGSSVAFNVSKVLIFGKNYARFEFGSPFSGFVAFTQTNGQDFSYPLTKNGSIQVVLPANYTSQARFLGVTLPEPDNIVIGSKGREVLIWESPYPKHRSIRVKYSHENAPTLLFYFLFSLFLLAVLVLGYYYMSMKALRKKRAMMEKDVRK